METNQINIPGFSYSKSPLAGDINWMETMKIYNPDYSYGMSPLAGDINWMETFTSLVNSHLTGGPHSLGILIEWKLYLPG